jgi:hypothetical protein
MTNNFSKTQRVSMNGFAFFAILTMIVLIAGGCSTLERTKYPEPGIIAVRNNSGVNLSFVSLRGVLTTVGKSVRMGSVSPVPKGATQVFERPSAPPPLPKRVVISWADHAQRQYEKEISLEHIISNSAETIKNTLVFEIGPSGRINVFEE